MTPESIQAVIFYTFALITVGAALMVILKNNPVISATYLVLAFFSLAAIYVLQSAFVIAVMQVLVYAGAIMVLFIFVIMLLNLKPLEIDKQQKRYPRSFVAFVMIVAIALTSLVAIGNVVNTPDTQGELRADTRENILTESDDTSSAVINESTETTDFAGEATLVDAAGQSETDQGIDGAMVKEKGEKDRSMQAFSRTLFTSFLLPFELTSLLLTISIIGVVVLAKGMSLRPFKVAEKIKAEE